MNGLTYRLPVEQYSVVIHNAWPYLQTSLGAVLCYDTYVSLVYTGSDEWVEIIMPNVTHLKYKGKDFVSRAWFCTNVMGDDMILL